MAPEKAVVLLSGGIDSAVSVYWAKGQGWDVRPLTFHYFRRPPQEVVATRKILEVSGVTGLQEIDLPFLREVDDLKEKGLENPDLLASPRATSPPATWRSTRSPRTPQRPLAARRS